MLTIILFGFLFLAVLMLFVITSAFVGFLITRVPFVRTVTRDIEFIVKKLNILSNEVFYDLGSGDGKVCFLVNQLTGAKCVGFELTWWTYLLAQIKLKVYPVKSREAGTAEPLLNRVKSQKSKIEFHRKDFFNVDWVEANVIYAYLYPIIMGRVEEKFKAEMKPGSLAIVRDFPFPNMKPKEVFFLPKEHEIYVYQHE